MSLLLFDRTQLIAKLKHRAVDMEAAKLLQTLAMTTGNTTKAIQAASLTINQLLGMMSCALMTLVTPKKTLSKLSGRITCWMLWSLSEPLKVTSMPTVTTRPG